MLFYSGSFYPLCTYAFVKLTNFIKYLDDSMVLITESDKVISKSWMFISFSSSSCFVAMRMYWRSKWASRTTPIQNRMKLPRFVFSVCWAYTGSRSLWIWIRIGRSIPELRIRIRVTGIHNRFFSGSRISDPGSQIPDPKPVILRAYWQVFEQKFL
jgi:hypothetical protein